MEKELQVLEYKTVDVEPTEPVPPVLVELGDTKYKAYCPNDYQFAELVKAARQLDLDPTNIDVDSLLEGFFKISERRDIKRRLSQGEIDFLKELAPAVNALTSHFMPLVQERIEELQKRIKVKK